MRNEKITPLYERLSRDDERQSRQRRCDRCPSQSHISIPSMAESSENI